MHEIRRFSLRVDCLSRGIGFWFRTASTGATNEGSRLICDNYCLAAESRRMSRLSVIIALLQKVAGKLEKQKLFEARISGGAVGSLPVARQRGLQVRGDL